jgi:hypothetical protein
MAHKVEGRWTVRRVTGSRRSSTTVENVQSTPTGQERVEERRDWDTP